MLFKKLCVIGLVYGVFLGATANRVDFTRSLLTDSDLKSTGGDYGWGWFSGTDCAVIAGFVPTPCPQNPPPAPSDCPCLFPVFGQCMSGGTKNVGQYVCVSNSYYLYDEYCDITSGEAVCNSNDYGCYDDYDLLINYCAVVSGGLNWMCGRSEECSG